MESGLLLCQGASGLPEAAVRSLDAFNRGRTGKNGCYAISLPTAYRPYYGFWRLFPDEEQPLYVRTLGVALDMALERAFALLQNCNVVLHVEDNSMFEPYYGQTDDIIPFGKYRGKRLSEVFYVEPSYVLWLANKFVPSNRRYEPLAAIAKRLAHVHFELTIQKRHISSVSRAVGAVGEKLGEMFLSVASVRLQVDTYRPDFYVDQRVLATDLDGNRFVFLLKAAGRSLTPNALSCHSRRVSVHESLHLLSSKVLSHYESHGVHYTRLGYVKLA